MLQTITGLTSKTRESPELFGLDLNCAIYHCVHKLQKTTPYTPEGRLAWEKKLIEHVLAYITQMSKVVNATGTIYVAVDGVCPMAKIKQQRCRRFKSAIEAETMARIKADALGKPYVAEPRWDTNAITPGTAFMANLASALRDYASRHPKVVVSPADEPGEGEQKIMDYIRAKRPKSSVVYGLDADLIVLSLLTGSTTNTPVDLFREETEFNGTIKTDNLNQEQFLFMDIRKLASVLQTTYGYTGQTLEHFINDFVGLMSLLGNDFVPHGMGLKIRDEGISILMGMYAGLQTQLVNPKTWSYNEAAFLNLFTAIAAQEPRLMLKCIKRKLETRVGSTGSKDVVDQALARFNDTPVLLAAEAPLIQYMPVPGIEKPQLQFKATWTELYDTKVFHGADQDTAVKLYIQSIFWTLRYYAGMPIDSWYYYPYHLPPRASTVVEYLKTKQAVVAPVTQRPLLEPQTQLAMVLPETSYNLLPQQFSKITANHPYAFPVSWANYSFGRRFMWECEPLIPLVQPATMKQWISEIK